MISAVAGKGIFGFERSFARNLPVNAGKVRFLGRAQQFLETLDHEIDALEFVEMIFGPHHALDIEPDAPRFGRGERRNRLGMARQQPARSEEHTSELQSLMRISYAVFCLKK